MKTTGNDMISGTPVGQREWVARAACAEMELDEAMATFFGEATGVVGERAIAKAKAICGGCAVRAECLKHAMRLPEEFGIFGGLTKEERSAGRPRRPPAPAHGANGYDRGCRCDVCRTDLVSRRLAQRNALRHACVACRNRNHDHCRGNCTCPNRVHRVPDFQIAGLIPRFA